MCGVFSFYGEARTARLTRKVCNFVPPPKYRIAWLVLFCISINTNPGKKSSFDVLGNHCDPEFRLVQQEQLSRSPKTEVGDAARNNDFTL